MAHQRRMALAGLRTAAIGVIDVNAASAVLVGEGVVVDDHKVVRLSGRKAADRRKGDFTREKLLSLALGLNAGRGLLGRYGTGGQRCAGREENDATHGDLLSNSRPAALSAALAHERKLSFAARKRANSCTFDARTKGLVPRSS